MNKQYIFLAAALVMGTSLIAMESSPIITKKPGTLSTLNKDQHKRLDRLLEKFASSQDKKNALSDSEKDFFVKSYQTIHTNLSAIELIPQNEQNDESLKKLKEYKKKIYGLAKELLSSSKAAKQWLKQADYFSDEENEKKRKEEEQRADYYTAKRNLLIQENRKADSQGLDKTILTLKAQQDKEEKIIKDLEEKLARSKAELETTTLAQAKIAGDLQATKRTIENTEIVVSHIIDKLKAKLLAIVQKTAIAKAELTSLEASKQTVACDKTARTAEIKAKTNHISDLELRQAALQRDIDLLTKQYNAGEVLAWYATTLWNLYPIKAAPADQVVLTLHQANNNNISEAPNQSEALIEEDNKEKTE